MTSGAWAACETGAQLAGLIRLEALHREGGIYVDSDCEPYRSLEELLPLHAFAAWEDRTTVPDAVIGAEPGHPAIAAAIDLALARIQERATTGDRFTWSTGPGVLTELLPGRPDVTLLPPGAFYPYHYKEKDRRHEDHAGDQPWAFMAHHWAGSWLKPQQQSAPARARRAPRAKAAA
jgi:mannosyltransferase OCH1-like enzyme